MTSPTSGLHVAVSGWLLGEPSGANHRLQRIVAHAAARLGDNDRITVLHGPRFTPPSAASPTARATVHWQRITIPDGPLHRRALAERRVLGATLQELAVDVLDHGLLPAPRLPRSLPIALTIHDLRAVDGYTRWPRWLARAAVRQGVDRAAAIVVPSEFTRQRLGAVAPHATVKVIHNGVDLPSTPTADCDSGARPATAPIVHIGHLEPRKNLEVVLRALAQLPAAERPRFVLVGRDAGAAAALRRLADRLDVAAQFDWRGVRPADEVEALLRSARAVVVPSRYEGFGLPAIEGLAHGRPTLVANAGALPEVVGDAGDVLPPDDVAAWAAAIRATASPLDPIDVARRRGRAGELSWRDAAAATVTLWRQLAEASDVDRLT